MGGNLICAKRGENSKILLRAKREENFEISLRTKRGESFKLRYLRLRIISV